MKELPKNAQIYLFCVYAVALAALWRVATLPSVVNLRAEWLELLIFTVIAMIAGYFKIPIFSVLWKRDAKYEGAMSLGFAMIFAALLRFGPQGAVLVGLASTAASCLDAKKGGRFGFHFEPMPWFQFCFNTSINLVETSLAGYAFLLLNQNQLGLTLEHSLPAVVVACLMFFFVNTGAVAAIMGLCSRQKIYTVWNESLLWTAPSYFFGAAVSTAASAVFADKLIVTLVILAPIAFLTYQSYKYYTDKANALIASKDELATLYLATIRSLALAIDAKDQYTHKHILRVQKYSVATAKQMGFVGDDLKAMETGALLHDIGKLGVPEYVLLKPGRLTEDEFDKIKQHPNIGADILDPVTFPWPVLPIVKHHHERMDGTGYPDGLKGEAIPLSARILAVADVYDAVTSSRSYRSAWSHERAIEEIKSKSGAHFDPRVVEAFCAVIDDVLLEMAEEHKAEQAALGLGDALPAVEPNHSVGKDAATTPRSAEAARHIQRASSELWALYEVAQTLSASLGITDTLQILARKLNAIFPETGCVFLLRDFTCGEDVSNVFMARSAVGLNAAFFEGCQTLRPTSLSLRVARDRCAYLGEYDHDDLMPNSLSGAAWSEIGTALIVPIEHQGEILGTINLYHADKNAFGSHDQYLLEMIGKRAALALYNGLLFDRTRSDAITDPLTGLFNIRHFTDCVEERIRSEEDAAAPFALLCLDLDCFKPINDNFGHQRGDRVLSDVGQLLGSLVGKNDVVARYGGDEFLVLLCDAAAEEAAQTAQRIQEAVAAYNPHLRHPRLGDLRIDVSVGLACFPENGTDSATLLSVADAAMYGNKTERKLKNLAGMERNISASTNGNGMLVALSNLAIASSWEPSGNHSNGDSAGERVAVGAGTGTKGE